MKQAVCDKISKSNSALPAVSTNRNVINLIKLKLSKSYSHGNARNHPILYGKSSDRFTKKLDKVEVTAGSFQCPQLDLNCNAILLSLKQGAMWCHF